MLTGLVYGFDDVLVRTAQEQDLHQIEGLWQERQALLSQANPRFRAPYRASWYDAIQVRLDMVFVAVDDDEQIVGYIAGRMPRADAGLIDEMALDAHRYHGGVGRTVVRTMRDAFAEMQVSQVFVNVPRYHAVEQAFWRSLGAHKPTMADWMNEHIPSEFMWMTL